MRIAVVRFVVMGAVVMPVFLYLLTKLAALSIRDFVVLIGPSVLASIGVVTSIVLFRHVGPAVSKPLFQLLGEVFIGGITGLAVLLNADAQLRMTIKKLFGAFAEQLRGMR